MSACTEKTGTNRLVKLYVIIQACCLGSPDLPNRIECFLKKLELETIAQNLSLCQSCSSFSSDETESKVMEKEQP